MSPVVFLDTTVLLKAFGASRKEQELPVAFLDPSAERYTFEKCIFESYMAFRGVGGKKPDEGRGRWAEQNLNAPNDPSPLGQLASSHHAGSFQLSHFWINNIDSLHDSSWLKEGKGYGATNARIQELSEQRSLYGELCTDFRGLLESAEIEILSYVDVFGQNSVLGRARASGIQPETMDQFVRETAIPSEDYEIVFAALRLRPDLFVTDDERLRTGAWSLGLNHALSVGSFCSLNDYPAVMAEWWEAHREERLTTRCNRQF